MAKVRFTLQSELEVLSPLHVGTGIDRTIKSVVGEDGAEGPLVATIVRDIDHKPYLPPTTLKGLLRRLGEAHFGPDDARIARLFGDLEARKAGMVLMRGASLAFAAEARDMPFADVDLGKGVFVAARTSIDPATGVADDHKLHYAEMVAPLTRFRFALSIEARSGEAEASAEAAVKDLILILNELAAEKGASIGRGTADGDGRLRLLEKSISIARLKLAQSGDMERKDATSLWQARDRKRPRDANDVARFVLVAEGPFLIADSSRKPRGRQEANARRPQLAAQRTADLWPLILGSSISGPLRARARWLSALDSGSPAQHAEDPKLLTAEQRLFGTTAFKGLLSISVSCTNKPNLWTAASVRIDRFTGGPIQNALFHTEAFVGVRLDLTLSLETRPGKLGEPTEADRALFHRLVEDVREEGLMLGHGANRGYGWFRAEAA